LSMSLIMSSKFCRVLFKQMHSGTDTEDAGRHLMAGPVAALALDSYGPGLSDSENLRASCPRRRGFSGYARSFRIRFPSARERRDGIRPGQIARCRMQRGSGIREGVLLGRVVRIPGDDRRAGDRGLPHGWAGDPWTHSPGNPLRSGCADPSKEPLIPEPQTKTIPRGCLHSTASSHPWVQGSQGLFRSWRHLGVSRGICSACLCPVLCTN